MTPYERQTWQEILDLYKQLVKNQEKLIEFFLEQDIDLQKEGGNNIPEGMEIELSNQDML